MSGRKILVVDDEPSIVEILTLRLSAAGFEVCSARNGDEAVAKAKSEKPLLIIMDVMMPGGIDGLEATRIIKSNPETRNCHVIILSAKGQQTDRESGKNAGADDYFIKPFSPLDLIKKVEEVLDSH